MTDKSIDNASEPNFFLNWPSKIGKFLAFSSKLTRTRCLRHPDLKSPEGPFIFVQWHNDDLTLAPMFGSYKVCALVSPSRDGAAFRRSIEAMGCETRMGSSSRGGAEGLLALKKRLESGQHVILAADGPRGPFHVAKPGPVYLAAKTGKPIVAVAAACHFKYVSKSSWSKSALPLPGAKIVVSFSPPLYVPPEAIKWPKHVQSRFLGVAISDQAQEAEMALRSWNNGKPDASLQKLNLKQYA